MRIYLLSSSEKIPTIDLLSGARQIFQGVIPSIDVFLVKNPSQADIFLVPHDAAFWNTHYMDVLRKLSDQKPIMFFNRSDRPLSVRIPNSFSLQNSFRCKGATHQILIPYNILSLNHLPVRNFSHKPIVSFTGFVPRISLGRIRDLFLQNFPNSIIDNPLMIRRIGIRTIQKEFPDSLITVRSHYGGAKSLIRHPASWRSEFEQSVKESDLVFCPRGDANTSQRLYEVMSAGRIPVVPDTQQRIPKCFCKASHIDYFVRVGMFSLDIKSRVEELWTQLDQESYIDLQRQLRKYYTHCLNYQAFISRLFSVEAIDLLRFVER